MSDHRPTHLNRFYSLLDELERTGKGTGLATLCIASGMGAATIIERL